MKGILKTVGFLIVALSLIWLGRVTVLVFPDLMPTTGHSASGSGGGATLWTCPMHPEIKLPDNVPCPKCGMDLVEFDPSNDVGPRRLAISAAAAKLAGIETAPVRRRFLNMPLRMVGKVEFDETRVRTIAARVPGRLDRLYVDYKGISVKQNDHLVWLYSPDLLTAQQELIQAQKRVLEATDEQSEFLRESNRRSHQSAREKLLLWGLTEDQVDVIEKQEKAEDLMMVRSPMTGVVIEKLRREGAYVEVGTPIYRIADLTHLWIKLEAYEQDLPWLRYGQQVSISTEALPGERFDGWIAFLDPTVDERTRTVNVRVNVQNIAARLKPGMFVRAVVEARIGDRGAVLMPRLAGKWISPMHPEIIKDEPGKCDVCGMDLVPAESLGYVDTENVDKPLVVPASAVLVTGTRAVVYVAVLGTEKPTYEGREVILGPRAGDFYVVRSGLNEHERVVVNGAFRVDSAMQIQAKPSMMTMRGEKHAFTGPDTAALRATLAPVYAAYMEMQKALGGDDVEAARAAAGRMHEAVGAVAPGAISREARSRLDDELPTLERASRDAAAAGAIAEVREHFQDLSRSVLSLERTFRHLGETMHYEAYCPMAFDNTGAAWMQDTERLLNPYFGARMLRCGEIREKLPGVVETARHAHEGHKGPETTTQPPGKK